MSTPPPSRTPVAASVPVPAPVSLADVAARVTEDPSLRHRRRQEMLSGLNTAAKVLDTPLTRLPAHPPALQLLLKAALPTGANVAPGRWRNVQSLLRAAMELVGATHVPARSRQPLMPAWAVLVAPLVAKHLRLGLSRFSRFCSLHSIQPAEVDDRVLQLFLGDLQHGGLIRNPRGIHRMTCEAWNEAAATVDGWPAQLVAVPSYSRTYALSQDAILPSLQTDIDQFLARLGDTNIFAEHDFRALKPASVATRQRQLGELVAATVLGGHDVGTLHTLADVVQPDRVRAALRHVLARADQGRDSRERGQPTVHMGGLARLAASVAEHWVKAEPEQVSTLRALCRRVTPVQSGMSRKNRTSLRVFDDDANVRRLLALPQLLAAKAKRTTSDPRRAALMMQTAVALEISLMVPMRLKNLTELEVGRHLIRVGRDGMRLVVPDVEVKNNVGLEAMLQPGTVKLIQLYCDHYRDQVASQPGTFLFPGTGGGAKDAGGLSKQITAAIAEHAGFRLTPHQLRHFGAMHYLRAHPDGIAVVRQFLGHRGTASTEKFYAPLQTPAAIHAFDEHVLQLRAGDAPAKASRGTGT